MALFKKKKKPKQTRARQRPASDGPKRSSAFSYGATRQDAEVQAARDEQRAKNQPKPISPANYWLRRIGLLVLLLALTASITSSLTLSTDAEIVAVDDNNSTAFLSSETTYQAAAQKLLAESFFNQNKVTIDTDKISKELVKQFPELSNASVTLPLLAHRPIIHIQAAKPSVILNSSGGSYVLDANGRALIPSGKLPSSVRDTLPQINDQSGLEVRLGTQVLTRGNIEFIETVVGQLANKQVKVESFTLPAGTSELDAKIAGQPYFAKFNLQTPPDARQQAGTFLATKAMLERKNTPASKYIDVRVEGRAYYQ